MIFRLQVDIIKTCIHKAEKLKFNVIFAVFDNYDGRYNREGINVCITFTNHKHRQQKRLGNCRTMEF